ncbi:MAG: ABC transporter ATP-binding protein [Nitrospinae bacterium]|nr:ABC transporter ATP-binding protein [Nitrospinota bacterium]MBF0635288.1 ABC transporter ATP-binding protein [Nitrospinota bacterium]
MGRPVIVEGRNVVKRYGSLLAVNDVDFSILDGEGFGFLGPNGAGKTSVMRMIQRLSPLTSGSIVVDGKTAGVDDRNIKSILGVAPQDESLDDDLTVLQNLTVYADYFGIPSKSALDKAESLLNFFELNAKRDEKIRSLSGGMRRRLLIARALVNDPKILILDEPTTGLDPQARMVIWEKLESLHRQGVTLILTTHYMEEAARLCGRVAIMDMGKIIALGHPATLVEERLGSVAAELHTDEEMADTAGKAMKDLGVTFEKTGSRYLIFHPPDTALEKLKQLGTVTVRRPTLEDLFIHLTGRGLAGGG